MANNWLWKVSGHIQYTQNWLSLGCHNCKGMLSMVLKEKKLFIQLPAFRHGIQPLARVGLDFCSRATELHPPNKQIPANYRSTTALNLSSTPEWSEVKVGCKLAGFLPCQLKSLLKKKILEGSRGCNPGKYFKRGSMEWEIPLLHLIPPPHPLF